MYSMCLIPMGLTGVPYDPAEAYIDELSRDPFVGFRELRVIMSDANGYKVGWCSILAHRECPNNTGSIVRYLFGLARFGLFFSSGQILNI